MTTTLTITLEIEGAPEDAEYVLDCILDAGELQDLVNEHAYDVGPLRVTRATCESTDPNAAPVRRCPSCGTVCDDPDWLSCHECGAGLERADEPAPTTAASDPLERLERALRLEGALLYGHPGPGEEPDVWSIERHGKGETLYLGRCGPPDGMIEGGRHGLNVIHLTEPAQQWPQVRELIVAALNAAPVLLEHLRRFGGHMDEARAALQEAELTMAAMKARIDELERRAGNERDDLEQAGEVSVQDARDILSRFVASYFRDNRERARFSIPANPKRDDDIRMSAFISRAERAFEAIIERDRRLVEALELAPRTHWEDAVETAGTLLGRIAEQRAELTRLHAAWVRAQVGLAERDEQLAKYAEIASQVGLR